MTLVEKIVAVHGALSEARIPHAFGGALALAWCTERARGTIDIDINIFAGADQLDAILDSLPEDVVVTSSNRKELVRDGQSRLVWEKTPIDMFLNTTDFHEQAATRIRFHEFGGALVPFLGCTDLAVFKVFFDRTKDWADLEEMLDAKSLDVQRVVGVLATYLGLDDHRVAKLLALAGP